MEDNSSDEEELYIKERLGQISDEEQESDDEEDLDTKEDRKVWSDDDNEPQDQQNESQIDQSQESSVVIEPFDFKTLPDYSCVYCGIHDPKTMVKCKSKNCNKWFCNGKGSNDYGSHILWHMVKANHKEIQVHPESPLKDSPLECYLCGSKNMFLLGYISAKTEACIILLCREPCLSNISQKDDQSHLDTTNWLPLIENKAIQPWLVSEPCATDI